MPTECSETTSTARKKTANQTGRPGPVLSITNGGSKKANKANKENNPCTPAPQETSDVNMKEFEKMKGTWMINDSLIYQYVV